MLAVVLEEAGSEHPMGAPLGVPAPGVLLERLRAFMDNHPGRVAVAEVGGVQVGAAISLVQRPGLFSETPWLQIEILYVRPEWRRRGVGRALLADQAVFAAASGTDTIVTLPVSGSRSEQRFLSRLGFSAVGSRRACETATLQRRLGQDSPRSGLESLIARRRAMNAVTTPPRGIDLAASSAQHVPQEGETELFPVAPAVVEPLAPSSRRQVRRAELMRRSASSVTSTR
jgi:GNAT superfamily N-acetyltransferase